MSSLEEYQKAYEEIYALMSESHEYMTYGSNWYVASLRLKSVLAEVCNLNPKLILDLGCGDGIYAIIFARNSVNYIGVDISLSNLHRTRSWSKNEKLEKFVNLILCDVNHLPFKSASIETILCSEVLEHLLDFKGGLLEISRIAQNNFILSLPCFGAFVIDDIIGNRVAKQATQRNKDYISQGTYKSLMELMKTGALHINFFTSGILKKELFVNGFEIKKILGCGFDFPVFRNSIRFQHLTIARIIEIMEISILSKIPIFNLSPFLNLGNENILIICKKVFSSNFKNAIS